MAYKINNKKLEEIKPEVLKQRQYALLEDIVEKIKSEVFISGKKKPSLELCHKILDYHLMEEVTKNNFNGEMINFYREEIEKTIRRIKI